MWFISLDTETTGLNPDLHEVLELKATALTRDLKPLGNFYVKIQMMHPELASPEALKINKYSSEAWADAKAPKDAYEAFVAWISEMRAKIPYLSEYRFNDPIALGQNPGFDVDMITKNAARASVTIKFSYHRFDVVTLSMLMDILRSSEPNFVWQKSYSLEKIAKVYGINKGEAHTAEADEATHLCLLQYYIEQMRRGFNPRKCLLQRFWLSLKNLITLIPKRSCCGTRSSNAS